LPRKPGLELNDVRRALFILYENDLATYPTAARRGLGVAHTYLWTFHYENIPEALESEMYRLLDALEQRRAYERDNEFYLCETCGIRFEFAEAMEFGFECPECGNQVETMENTRLVDAMDGRIDRLRDELNVDAETETEAEA